MRWGSIAAVSLALLAAAMQQRAVAQQVTVGSPFQRVGHSFSESINVGFGLNLPGGVSLNVGSPSAVVGSGAGGGARFGFGINSDEGSAFFNIAAAQGSRSTLTSQTPSVTVMNGRRGFVADTAQSPFVIGVVPVVGSLSGVPVAPQPAPPRISPLQERLSRIGGVAGLKQRVEESGQPQPALRLHKAPRDPVADKVHQARGSSAGQGALSLAEIRAAQQAQQSQQHEQVSEELRALIGRAESAEREGKLGAARIYFQMAQRRASGKLKEQLADRLAGLESD